MRVRGLKLFVLCVLLMTILLASTKLNTNFIYSITTKAVVTRNVIIKNTVSDTDNDHGLAKAFRTNNSTLTGKTGVITEANKTSTPTITNKDGEKTTANRTSTQTLTTKNDVKAAPSKPITQQFTSLDKLYYNKYLKYANLEIFPNTLADLSKSRVNILKSGNLTFNVGDIIRIRIELYNVNGDMIRTGGDLIKIWMKDTDKKAGSSGYVTDHGNGSYTGTIHALWSGMPVIKISRSFSKEAIGLYVNQLQEHGMFFKSFGVFKNSRGKISRGICGTHQHVGINVCNFTSLNSGLDWYCALPKKFACNNRYGPYTPRTTPFTNKELRFVRSNKNIIFREIQIQVRGDIVKEPDISCNRVQPSATWNNLSPIGFFHRNIWRSLICKYNLSHSLKKYTTCLTNREIFMHGDSTVRFWLVAMVKMLDLNVKKFHEHKIGKAVSKLSNNENISVIWLPHELPFMTRRPDAFYDDFKAPAYYLDKITSKRPIIIIHWYLHMSIILSSVFQEHVRNTKRAIIKFLKRKPDTKIFIKGPHNVADETGTPYDFTRFYIENILFREFREIKDKIYFLNEWDLTVASESKDRHPSKDINKQMIHNFLAFIC